MNAILCAAFATMEDCEVGSQQMFGDSYEFKLRNVFWARGCFRVLAKNATKLAAKHSWKELVEKPGAHHGEPC